MQKVLTLQFIKIIFPSISYKQIMKNLLVRLLPLVILCNLLTPLNIHAASVKLATLDWEPYIGKNLKGQGFVSELVKEAFRLSGHSVKLSFLPWARVVHMAGNGEYDGYVPEYYDQKLEEKFYFSDPFPGGPLVFFKRKEESINYTTLQDLKPYTIGVVRGYVNTVEFDKATFIKKEPAKNDLQNLRKLINKRIDMVIADKYVGLYLLRTYLSEYLNDIDYIAPPLEIKKLHLCVTKKTPNARLILADFNKGLSLMQHSGFVKKLLKRHKFIY